MDDHEVADVGFVELALDLVMAYIVIEYLFPSS